MSYALSYPVWAVEIPVVIRTIKFKGAIKQSEVSQIVNKEIEICLN